MVYETPLVYIVYLIWCVQIQMFDLLRIKYNMYRMFIALPVFDTKLRGRLAPLGTRGYLGSQHDICCQVSYRRYMAALKTFIEDTSQYTVEN